MREPSKRCLFPFQKDETGRRRRVEWMHSAGPAVGRSARYFNPSRIDFRSCSSAAETSPLVVVRSSSSTRRC